MDMGLSDPCPANWNGNGGVTRIEARHDAGGSFCPEWRLRLVGMLALPGDLLFTEFDRVFIGQGQQDFPLSDHFDHRTFAYRVLVHLCLTKAVN